jgi:hypothetical protein
MTSTLSKNRSCSHSGLSDEYARDLVDVQDIWLYASYTQIGRQLHTGGTTWVFGIS